MWVGHVVHVLCLVGAADVAGMSVVREMSWWSV